MLYMTVSLVAVSCDRGMWTIVVGLQELVDAGSYRICTHTRLIDRLELLSCVRPQKHSVPYHCFPHLLGHGNGLLSDGSVHNWNLAGRATRKHF